MINRYDIDWMQRVSNEFEQTVRKMENIQLKFERDVRELEKLLNEINHETKKVPPGDIR